MNDPKIRVSVSRTVTPDPSLLDMERVRARIRTTSNLPGQPNAKYFASGRATEIVGDLVGLSDRTVEKALYIVDDYS